MPRIKVQVSEKDLQALEALAANRAEDPRVVERAAIVLACLRGEALEDIARRFQASRSMIFRWRGRYFQAGLMGLWDKPRTGKPPRYDEEFEKQVLQRLQTPPPAGRTSWDGVSLAQELGSSPDAVWRVLRRKGISLARHRVWSAPAALPLTGRAKRIAGIYVSHAALMIALRPGHGKSASSQVITRDKDAGEALQAAVREGTLTLQQMMQIMGRSHGAKIAKSRKRDEILHFLDDMTDGLRAGEKLEVQVLGEAASLEIGSWIAAHPEVTFRFYDHEERVKEYLGECTRKGWITQEYADFFWQMLDYPREAAAFIWVRDCNHIL